MIATVVLANISIASYNCHFFFVVRTLKKIHSLCSFKGYITLLLVMITVLYDRSLKLNWKFVPSDQHLPFYSTPHSLGFDNYHFTFCFYEFLSHSFNRFFACFLLERIHPVDVLQSKLYFLYMNICFQFFFCYMNIDTIIIHKHIFAFMLYI